MKLRLLAALAGLALSTGAAYAQARDAQAATTPHGNGGIYLTPVYSNISDSTADTGPFAFLGDGKTSGNFRGFGMGGFYDFPHTSQLELGIDTRLVLLGGSGNNATLNSFQLGLRVAHQVQSFPIRPYAEVMVGVGSSKAPTAALSARRGEYGIAVGADYKLNRVIDWRVLDINVNSIQTSSSGIFGGPNPATSSIMVNVATGLVFRIGKD